MRPTRRTWAVGGLAVVLAVFAVILDRPFPLVGTVFLGAWVISRQVLFYRAVTELADNLTVTQSSPQTNVRTNETVPATLSVRLETPSTLEFTVDGGVPTAANASQTFACTVDAGSTSESVTVDIQWPVAGRHRFSEAIATVDDGLFEQRIPVGSTPAVTVEPRGPRNVHVGEGGDRIATAYGEHETGRLGSGLEPAELREYVPGDTADRIDWNATARLGTPYVREFEAETDRKTMLVLDHRHSLHTGPPDETKLDYLRELALALADSARQLGDPLGIVAVGDEGITERHAPSTQPDQYVTIRRTLLDLDTTSVSPVDQGTGTTLESGRTPDRGTSTLAGVRNALASLDGEDTPFANTLRPFYAETQTYLDRIDSDPLYTAVKSTLAREEGSVFTVLYTDDSTPTELVDTVKLASRRGGAVLVLLAPTVLYEQGGLSDIEGAYERYLAFEELRRELSRLDRVTALEVGPGDRLSAVLSAGRTQRVRTPAGGDRR